MSSYGIHRMATECSMHWSSIKVTHDCCLSVIVRYRDIYRDIRDNDNSNEKIRE